MLGGRGTSCPYSADPTLTVMLAQLLLVVTATGVTTGFPTPACELEGPSVGLSSPRTIYYGGGDAEAVRVWVSACGSTWLTFLPAVDPNTTLVVGDAAPSSGWGNLRVCGNLVVAGDSLVRGPPDCSLVHASFYFPSTVHLAQSCAAPPVCSPPHPLPQETPGDRPAREPGGGGGGPRAAPLDDSGYPLRHIKLLLPVGEAGPVSPRPPEPPPTRPAGQESAVPIFLGVVAFSISMALRLCLCRGKQDQQRQEQQREALVEEGEDPPPAYHEVCPDPPPPYPQLDTDQDPGLQQDLPPPYPQQHFGQEGGTPATQGPRSSLARAFSALSPQFAFTPLREE